MSRTKADFKAEREALGLSQQDMADALDVRCMTVKRWERPGFPEPPEDAWERLAEFRELHNQMVDYTISIFEHSAADELVLTYYRDQSMYNVAHDDGGSFAFANAASREAAAILRDGGRNVRFEYAFGAGE